MFQPNLEVFAKLERGCAPDTGKSLVGRENSLAHNPEDENMTGAPIQCGRTRGMRRKEVDGIRDNGGWTGMDGGGL